MLLTNIPFFIVTGKNTDRRHSSLHKVVETFDSSPVRHHHQIVMIEQCPLLWPAFGINKKRFEGPVLFFIFYLQNIYCLFSGQIYSVTNTCNIDSPLFVIYAVLWTDSTIKNIILNSESEPFLSLRKTFELVESDGWDEARLYWLITHSLLGHQQSNIHNAYGSVDGNTLRCIKNPIQLYKSKSVCARQDCSTRERTIISCDVALE
jgi:hypothetical protein